MSQSELAFVPRVVRKSDPSKLEIEWADGHSTSYSAAELRALCPCAHCVDELTGVRVHDPHSVPADLRQEDLRLIGNYALSLRFSDGHHTGIFTWPMLRERDPRP